ncbi:RHS repeat-associated core domain-containing protein, partial [Rhodanobacter koreensis]
SQALGMAPNGPGYTGHVNDPDTGLVYMQARYYDPAVGRFISTDPAGLSAGNTFNFSRYAYANNNPVVNMDPDGRCTGSLNQDSAGNCADSGLSTSNSGPSSGGVRLQPKATGSTSNGGIQSARPPADPKIEASGFPSDLDAAKAAGKAYGAQGTMKHQEVELGLVQIKVGNWGYLTPGWGPVGATLVDPTPVFQAYTNAGLSVNEWMHGHFDGQLGFSATDMGIVYGQSAPYRTFMVNSRGETRWMSNQDLLRHRGDLTPDEAIRGLQGYQELLPNGLPGH